MGGICGLQVLLQSWRFGINGIQWGKTAYFHSKPQSGQNQMARPRKRPEKRLKRHAAHAQSVIEYLFDSGKLNRI